MALSKGILQKSVGGYAYSPEDEEIGRIIKIMRDIDNNPQYIIISSNNFFKNGSRFFAVPICTSFIEIEKNGKTIINADKDDFQGARRVNINKCPRVRENGFPYNIYEVYRYRASPNLNFTETFN